MLRGDFQLKFVEFFDLFQKTFFHNGGCSNNCWSLCLNDSGDEFKGFTPDNLQQLGDRPEVLEEDYDTDSTSNEDND